MTAKKIEESPAEEPAVEEQIVCSRCGEPDGNQPLCGDRRKAVARGEA